MERPGRKSPKTRAMTVNAMTLSVVKEATTSSVGGNRACSDERYRKNKYSDGKTPTARDRVPLKKSICYGYG